MDPTISALLTGLKNQRFDLGSEKRLQAELTARFTTLGLDFSAEYRLDPASIIDFKIGSIGVEVKIKGTAKDIYRQCARYCTHESISQLVLLTNKIIALPPTINGKPTLVFNLGRAWL